MLEHKLICLNVIIVNILFSWELKQKLGYFNLQK